MASPLQCEATEYASSFSRAAEWRGAGRRHLYVSGTASIAEDGSSAHRGDVDRQIHLSIAVVEALLVSRGFQWSDVTRAVGYFRDGSNAPRLAPLLVARGMPAGALRTMPATICRDDLLFEIELDAQAAQA